MSSPYAEEKGARLYRSPEQRGTYSPVQPKKPIVVQALFKAVQWSLVLQRQVIWLRLQADLDGIERILYVLPSDAGKRTKRDILQRFFALVLDRLFDIRRGLLPFCCRRW